MQVFDSILKPIMWVVAWIMYGAHKLGKLIHLSDSISWVASIVVLVIIMRVIMIPLFVKQIKTSRGMQLIQPELQKIQRRYKGKTDPVSRRRMQEETMALYRAHGSNPMSGCWPVLAQSPLFFALFRVLYNLSALAKGEYSADSIGPITKDVAEQIVDSMIFGAPLSASFMDQATWGPDPDVVSIRVVTVVLIILMSVTTFTTQRQLTMKNMPASAQDNPMFRVQKSMMYAMPAVFAVTGINFPIGVLVYWLTTNLWSMGQQFIVIRNSPAPGSEAEKRLKERRARKRARKGLPPEDESSTTNGTTITPAVQRVQPKRTTRSQRRSGPLQAANPSPRPDAPRREIEPNDAAPKPAKQPTKGKGVVGAHGPGPGVRPAAKASSDSSISGTAADAAADADQDDTTSAGSTGSARPQGTGPAIKASGQRSQPKKSSRKKRK
jgi:YidC/Oxa1 family membrane protein insertase